MQIKQLKLNGNTFAPLTVAEAVLVDNDTRLDTKLSELDGKINNLPTNSTVLLKEHAPSGNDIFFGDDDRLHVSVDLKLFHVLGSGEFDESSGKPNVTGGNTKIYLTPQDGGGYKEWLYVNSTWEEVGFLNFVEGSLSDVISDLSNLQTRVGNIESNVTGIEARMITAVDVTVSGGDTVGVNYEDIDFDTVYQVTQ